MAKWQTKPPPGTQIDRGHPLSRGLLSCYAFNEGAGSRVNDVAGGRFGTLTGTAWGKSRSGACLQLDGVDDYVSLGEFAGLGARNRTFAINVFTPSLVTGGHRMLSFQQDDVSTSPRTFEIDLRSGSSSAGFGASPFNGFVFFTAASTGWQQYVATITGQTVTLYINGVLIGSATNTGTAPNNCIGYIGRFNATTGLYCGGSVDNLSIWNRALSAREVAQFSAEPFQMFGKIAVPVYYSIGSRISPFWYARNVHQ